jgi:type IV pilus assembly protein PilC
MSLTAQAYAYKGRDGAGKLVKGRIEAQNESAVVARLRSMGVSPVSIDVAGQGTGLQMEIGGDLFQKAVKLKDLAVMSRQMSTMMGAGITLLRSLTILAAQTENPTLKKTLDDVRQRVETGSSLSEALISNSKIFPPLMIHLVRAGETGGFLDKSLDSISDTFEADVKLRATIKSAMTYPVIVLIMAIVAVIAMLIFIVPVFTKMFASLNAALPLPTQILVNVSQQMVWAGPLLVVLIVAYTFWYRKNKNTEKFRSFVDPLKLRVPIFGELSKKVAIARFARNFATMSGAGVPVLQSLAIVGETSGNWVVERALQRVQDSVRAGRTIAAPLADSAVFPSMVTQMVSVGEDAGALEPMLHKIADFYDDEVQSMTEQLASLIEPLMIGVIGVIVGGMIIALYMPMFTIYNAVSASG